MWSALINRGGPMRESKFGFRSNATNPRHYIAIMLVIVFLGDRNGASSRRDILSCKRIAFLNKCRLSQRIDLTQNVRDVGGNGRSVPSNNGCRTFFTQDVNCIEQPGPIGFNSLVP